jgi:hypothetical protein
MTDALIQSLKNVLHIALRAEGVNIYNDCQAVINALLVPAQAAQVPAPVVVSPVVAAVETAVSPAVEAVEAAL